MKRPAILLDRDGTLNASPDPYLTRVEDFAPIPGAFEAVGRLCRAGWPVTVITNQACIDKGIVTRDVVDQIHGEFQRVAAKHGGSIEAFYVAPDLPDSDSPRRKPKPGMLLEAAQDHGYDLFRSYMIGDSERDLLAGRAAGATSLLVLTGHGEEVQARNAHPADLTFPTLAEAADWILARGDA